MDKADLEKYGFSEEDAEIIGPNDLFLIERYENLFYMNPLELARAINDMTENDLIRFNNAVYGHGFNAGLMREKTFESSKYTTVNPLIFGEAVVRTGIFQAGYFDTLKEMFRDGTKPRPSILTMLFNCYPAFKEHVLKLKKAGIIDDTETGLKWNRDKIALAQYFDRLDCMERARRWSVVEKAFNERNLRQYLHNHNDCQRGKTSRDFEEIKNLLDL
jgi:hypothetical protein